MPKSWTDCLKIMSNAIDNGWNPIEEQRQRRERGEKTVYTRTYIGKPPEDKKMDTKPQEKELLQEFITALAERVKTLSLNVQPNGKNYRIPTMGNTLRSLISEVYGKNLSLEDKVEILGILEYVKMNVNS